MIGKLALDNLKRNKERSLSTIVAIALMAIIISTIVILRTSFLKTAAQLFLIEGPYNTYIALNNDEAEKFEKNNHLKTLDKTIVRRGKIEKININIEKLGNIEYFNGIDLLNIDPKENKTDFSKIWKIKDTSIREKTENQYLDAKYNYLYDHVLGKKPRGNKEVLLYTSDIKYFFQNYKKGDIKNNIDNQKLNDAIHKFINIKGLEGSEQEFLNNPNLLSFINFKELEQILGKVTVKIYGKEYNVVGIACVKSDEKVFGVITNEDLNALNKEGFKKSRMYYSFLFGRNEEKALDKVNNELKRLNISSKATHETNYNKIITNNTNNTIAKISSFLEKVLIVITAIVSISIVFTAFNVSVIEKKNFFGKLRTLGMTKFQIFKLILMESIIYFIISIIPAIILGMLISFIVTAIISPMFIELNVFTGMLYTIRLKDLLFITGTSFAILLISSILPSIKAMRISPIEAVRNIQDYVYTKNKIRTFGLFKLLFGIEGDLAEKNAKRSKKRFRFTIFIMSIAFILILLMTAIYFAVISNLKTFTLIDKKDIRISIFRNNSDPLENATKEYEDHMKKVIKDLKENLNYIENAKGYIGITTRDININDDLKDIPLMYGYNIDENSKERIKDDDTILLLSKKYKLSNTFIKKKIIRVDNKVKTIGYNTNNKLNVVEGNSNSVKITNKIYTRDDKGIEKIKEFKNIKYIKDCVTKPEIGLGNGLFGNISKKSCMEIAKDAGNNYVAFINIKMNNLLPQNRQNIEKDINEVIKKSKIKNAKINFVDMVEDRYYYAKSGLIFVSMILLLFGGFTIFIIFVLITNIFSTLTINLLLRAKEFAILRSLGMTKAQIKKQLYIENLIVSLKAAMYGLIFGIISSYFMVFFFLKKMDGDSSLNLFDENVLLNYMNSLVSKESIIVILISVLIIILITFISTMYARHKVEKQDIIDILRKENI